MNKKHLAAAFAVFAATTMSFSAFAASIDANARAYERAAAEQYTYAAPQAATPAYQSGYVTSAPRPGYKPLPAVPYTAGDMAQQMPVSKELGDPIFVAPQTTAVGLQIMDPIAPSYQPVYQETVNSVTANGNGSAYVSRYKTNQLNAFDLLLNGKTYTYDLPAYTNGYQVKTASTYNRAGDGVANVFSTNVITEAVINNNSLRITVNMTQPTAVAAAKLRSMQQTGQGVKQAAHYDVFNNSGRYIIVKSGAVTVPNGAQHPYATALFAVTEDTVAAVTVSGNTADAYDLVKGTAYAIAQSAKVGNARR